MIRIYTFVWLMSWMPCLAQTGSIRGEVMAEGRPAAFFSVGLKGTAFGTSTSEQGAFLIKNVPEGNYELHISGVGYETYKEKVQVKANTEITIRAELQPNGIETDEVVVTEHLLREVMH